LQKKINLLFLPLQLSQAITGIINGAKYDNFDGPDCTYVQSVAKQGSATNKGSAATALVQQ
jgi:hypothetical protein